VIPLAGDVPVGEIHKAVVWNDRYYLFSKNDHAIVCFGGDGSFIFQIAAQGNGPQEYLGPNNFFIDERNGELKVLSLDGDIVSFSPEDGSFIRRESTGYLMVNDASAIDDKTTALSIMGPEWNIEIRRDGREPQFLLPFNELRDFAISRNRFSREDGNLFLCYGMDDNIYSLATGSDDRDTTQVAFSIDFGSLSIPSSMYDDPEAVIARQETSPFATNLDDLNVTEDYVVFSYWHFDPADPEPSIPNVIYDRRTGETYNFPHSKLFLLPSNTTLPDGSFVSAVHPVRIFSEETIEIGDVSRTMREKGVVEEDNPVVILWKLNR
jgi:hypothetical protein